MINLFPVLRDGGASNGVGSRIIWSKEQIAYVIHEYEKNHNTKQLAQICGVSQDAIRRLLRKNKVKLKTVQQLGKEKHPKNSNYFSKIDTAEKAYWLGFLYADGCNYTNRKTIRINLQRADEEHLRKFLKAINATNTPVKYSKKCMNGKTYELAYISFSDAKMSRDLEKQGCVSQKSLVLKFPTKEMVPTHLLSHFIRGYFDGDGSLYYGTKPNSNLLYFNLNIIGTKDFLSGVLEYLNKTHLALECKKTHYVLHICGNKQLEKVMKTLYKDSNESIELTRKKDKFNLLLLQRIGREPRNLGCV